MKSLRFVLRNFAKVAEADVELRGISVIVGPNNSGKSTVGKALYSLNSVFRNLNERIYQSKLTSIDDLSQEPTYFLPFRLSDGLKSKLISKNFSYEDFWKGIQNEHSYVFADKRNGSLNKQLIDMMESQAKYFYKEVNKIISIKDETYRDAVIWDYFDKCFHSQVVPVFKKRKGTGSSLDVYGDSRISLLLTSASANVKTISIPDSKVCYVNGPTVLNLLNSQCELDALEVYDSELADEMRNAVASKSAGVVNSRKVLNRARLAKLSNIISRVVPGQIGKRVKGKLAVSTESGETISFENLSSGIKTFVTIWEVLEQGVISEGDVLILDEPEVRLHPEWQIICAEFIVLLCKMFSLRILLTSHSVDFIHALMLFVKKYKVQDVVRLYKSSNNDDGSSVVKHVDDDNWDRLFDTFVCPIDILEKIRAELPAEDPYGK